MPAKASPTPRHGPPEPPSTSIPRRRVDALDTALGAHVRAFRTARGMSQSDLGEGLGISFQQIQKYERGENRVSAAMLVRMAGLFDIPAAELLAPIEPHEKAFPYLTPEILFALADLTEVERSVTLDFLRFLKRLRAPR
jgi:transcriptional regulator with XRE-family HTH domain